MLLRKCRGREDGELTLGLALWSVVVCCLKKVWRRLGSSKPRSLSLLVPAHPFLGMSHEPCYICSSIYFPHRASSQILASDFEAYGNVLDERGRCKERGVVQARWPSGVLIRVQLQPRVCAPLFLLKLPLLHS